MLVLNCASKHLLTNRALLCDLERMLLYLWMLVWGRVIIIHVTSHCVAFILDVAHPWLLSRNDTEAAYLEGE